MVLIAGLRRRARTAVRGGAGHVPAASPRPRARRRPRLPLARRRPLSRRWAVARPRRTRPPARERGSQALEVAMILPVLALVAGLVVCAGLVGMEMVHAHGVAREAARAAAVGDDARAVQVARAAAGGRELSVRLDPPQGARAPGDLVTAEVGMRSRVLARTGIDQELRASATMQVEGP